MEYILGKVTQQAMNYAIRSGVTLTASYAIKQSSKLLQSAPKSNVTEELYELQQRLQHKIKIVSPAIDMIELIAARGNTSLESAVSLTKELRLDIQNLGQRLARAAAASEQFKDGSARNKAALKAVNEDEMKLIILDIKKLLTRIEDAVPLINLALTTSGARLSTQLPPTVSPSRLLQASTFLTAGDTQYMLSPHKVAQIGPTFTLSVYMLFAGHDRPETEDEIRNTTWKEVIHKARVQLRRVPLDVVLSTGSGSDALQSHEILASRTAPPQEETPSQLRAEEKADEFAYQMMVVEDYDDDRHHDFDAEDAKPGPFDDIKMAGIREMIPVHEISKIFYADTSKVLNIGMDAESNHPVLLLRRDVHAVAPRRMVEQEASEDAQAYGETDHRQCSGRPAIEKDKQYVQRDPWRFPPSLDLEWIAFEVYNEAAETESEPDQEGDDEKENDVQTPDGEPDTSRFSLSLSAMHINSPMSPAASQATPSRHRTHQPWVPQIKTSLSMLELLLRLTSLQQFQQQSHLSIPDELLNFFLEESASTGAGGDEQHRQAVRADARRRVGFDPYDESPIKRRGEDYQYGPEAYESPRTAQSSRLGYNSYPPSLASPGIHARSTPSGGKRASQPLAYESLTSGPGSPHAQTRSITGTPIRRTDVKVPPAGVGGTKDITDSNRPDWLRQREGTVSHSSPLRSGTVHRDEGIGTSPGSVPEDGHR